MSVDDNPSYVVNQYTLILIAAPPAIGLSRLAGFGGLTSIGHSVLAGAIVGVPSLRFKALFMP
jgi:ABC-type branched-subunit amino acid transport system permease subunit